MKILERKFLEDLIDQGLTIKELSSNVGLSETGIRYRLKKLNLKTKPNIYLKNRFKFSDEKLLEVWRESDSINQFLLYLGVGMSGGAWYHYKKRLLKLNVDVSIGRDNGRKRGGLKTAQLTNQKTILRQERLTRKSLKKHMNIHNVPYKCFECSIDSWKNNPIQLQIHHIDENKKNNLINNLMYLCPNCHSQKHF